VKIVAQRVAKAVLHVDGVYTGEISRGLVALVGFGAHDGEAELEYLAAKLLSLRVFQDAAGKMNDSLAQIHGGLMVVSQFTLYGDCRRGNRPDFTAAAKPVQAGPLYERFVGMLRDRVDNLVSGAFGSDMMVEIHNDGPVTIILETKERET